jgi:hypothetical protein
MACWIAPKRERQPAPAPCLLKGVLLCEQVIAARAHVPLDDDPRHWGGLPGST